MKVLITGATGFVGGALCEELSRVGFDVLATVRGPRASTGEISNTYVVGEIDSETDWCTALNGVNAVVHLAARVHVMRDAAVDPMAAFRAVNTEGTLNLARQSAAAGVQRFVFISSIKVNGEGSNISFAETDSPSPLDAYAISKWEAEQGLREIESKTGMEVVILRPPLVYGPDVKANFLRLMQAVAKGLPLPFGRIENHRSLLFLGNFTDAIRLCLEHPAAAGKTYLLSDGQDVSSADLIRLIASCMNCSPRLLPIPAIWLRLAGRLLGRTAEMDRLLGSLMVDSSAIRRDLGWQPPYTLEQGLRLTVDHFTRSRGGAA